MEGKPDIRSDREADRHYKGLLALLLLNGDRIETRNHPTLSVIDAPPCFFYETPLVTSRKTAWKKSLREMEWFLSGNLECPADLLDWWQDQLCDDTRYKGPKRYLYHGGYGAQLRSYGAGAYDQITALIEGLLEHPHSRRLITTTWNPDTMSCIAELNDNPKTPATCHGTLLQAFVRNGALHLKTYQRSADILLGVPHNWLQYWGVLLWLSARANLKPGSLQWLFGDLHLYDHPSHLEIAHTILDAGPTACRAQLHYTPSGDAFKADDFTMVGEIPEPVTTLRPPLL